MYNIMKLNYDYSDLEPYIDTHTVGLHYNKHYRNYLNNLNKLLISNNYDFTYPIEQLHLHINQFRKEDIPDILFNLGGVLNHELYFSNISPKNNNNDYSNLEIVKEVENKFGSLDNFKNEFRKLAKSLKGSGYTSLVLDGNELRIVNTQNQDSPYFFNLKPLITLDMWEHAYYINYENNKDEYIDAFFEILNWEQINNSFKNFKR